MSWSFDGFQSLLGDEGDIFHDKAPEFPKLESDDSQDKLQNFIELCFDSYLNIQTNFL